MHTAKQFTRNADNFYLQVELHAHALTFLLASTNEEEFYEFRLTATPPELRAILPTLNHFFFYLLKNYEHPKAFRIDPCARIHINVPCAHDRHISVVLAATRITRDSIMPDDFLLQEEPEVQEVKPIRKSQPEAGTLAPFFGKKKKRGSETHCLDLEEDTPRSQSLCQSTAAEKEAVRNRQICDQAEALLREGLVMREVKQRLRLSDRTAWKMYQQFQKCGRIFTPEQTITLRKNRQAKRLVQAFKQQNPQASAETLSAMLEKRGIEHSKETIEQWLSCNTESLIYYEESQSAGTPCAAE